MLSGLWRRLSGRPDAAPVPVRSGGGLLALGGPVTPRVGSSDDERIDTPLLLVAAALVLFGVVMVYSASITLADSPRYKVTPTHFLVRHLFAIAVAMSFAIGCCCPAWAPARSAPGAGSRSASSTCSRPN